MARTGTRIMHRPGTVAGGLLLRALVLSIPSQVAAQSPPTMNALEHRCWQAHTGERTEPDLREPTALRFTNLRSGFVVRSPVWVEFSVRGMGVIPAGHPQERTGHHHLLIDTPLPKDYREQIPFSDKYRHFGKGQTGASLELAPGPHTLRLLFADHAHRPYFVFSNEIHITVAGPRNGPGPQLGAENFETQCPLWYQEQLSRPPEAKPPAVYVKNLREGDVLNGPGVVAFGLLGLGVAPGGARLPDSGHFSYTVRHSAGAMAQGQNLTDGRTEALLDLPRGDYELQLSLLDDADKLLMKAAPLHFSVQRP